MAVEDGHFSVMLGDGKNPADDSALNVSDIFTVHDQTWSTVCVGEGCLVGDELSPRQGVGSVPYAVKAERAGDFLVSGNVGIGAAEPTDRLHIVGNQSQILRVESDGNDAVLHLDSSSQEWDLDNDGNGSISDKGDLHLRRKGEPTPVMTWKSSSGKVGVGIAEPAGSLHVKTTSHDVDGGLVVEDDNSSYKCWFYITGRKAQCTDAGGSVVAEGKNQATFCARCQ